MMQSFEIRDHAFEIRDDAFALGGHKFRFSNPHNICNLMVVNYD